MILACKEIKKTFGVNIVLDNITFHLEQKEKASIVGVNGAGKTTLFKILTEEINADGGEIYLKKETSIGYLAQNQQIDTQTTILEEMMNVFEKVRCEEQNLREMENKMSYLEGKELSDYMEKYAQAQQKFEHSDSYGYESRIKGVLKGLGFLEEDYNTPICQLSGGQKTRVYLSKLLLSKPDILLLDEPTNHLDIASIQWLEDFLKGYSGTVLLISHDRYFLDKIVTKVIEVKNLMSMKEIILFTADKKILIEKYSKRLTMYSKKKSNVNKMLLRHCVHLIEKSLLKGQKAEKKHYNVWKNWKSQKICLQKCVCV